VLLFFMAVQVGNKGLVNSLGILRLQEIGETDIQISNIGDPIGAIPENITDQILEVLENSGVMKLMRFLYGFNLYKISIIKENLKQV